MTGARAAATATLLPSGRVLIAGGSNDQTTLSSAELYDPTTGTFMTTGSMVSGRVLANAVLLSDGRVLVVGGYLAEGGSVQKAELYDPQTGTFIPAGLAMTFRVGSAATLLADGRVLITGGIHNAASGSAETYNPKTRSFSWTGSMAVGRKGHTATLLADGRVLIAGGRPNDDRGSIQAFASAELYDPKKGTFSATGEMLQSRFWHTATLLSDGRALIAGGNNGHGVDFTAELYDPLTGTFTGTGPLAAAREYPTATLLSDGRVLVAGGEGQAGVGVLDSAELYSSTTTVGTFAPAGSMTSAREVATATLLPDGRVLIAGGKTDSAKAVASAELFQP